MYKISIVILHYNNKKDTINAVKSIQNLSYNKNKILIDVIIIDNNSPNDSGTELKQIYEKEKQIKVYILDDNYGFSKANNIGYQIAKNNGADTIMVINNDIVFEDKLFIDKYLNFIKKEHYDIIAPDIININNQHQNPLSLTPTTKTKAYKNYYKELIYYIVLSIPIINNIIYNIRRKKEEKWFENYYKQKESKCDHLNLSDFIPFGAFIIYTNNWIKKEEIAFPSQTFMYEEEEILYLYLKKKKYKLYYLDELKVKHLEGQSTKKRTKNIILNEKFKSKNKRKSLKEYIKVLKKEKYNG